MNRRSFLRGIVQAAGLAIAANYTRVDKLLKPVEPEPAFSYYDGAPSFTVWEKGNVICSEPTMPSELLAGYRQAIEAFKRFRDEKGEYLVFEDEGEHLVWCHPDDRQAFIDAGVPAESLVHAGGLRPEFEEEYKKQHRAT